MPDRQYVAIFFRVTFLNWESEFLSLSLSLRIYVHIKTPIVPPYPYGLCLLYFSFLFYFFKRFQGFLLDSEEVLDEVYILLDLYGFSAQMSTM